LHAIFSLLLAHLQKKKFTFSARKILLFHRVFYLENCGAYLFVGEIFEVGRVIGDYDLDRAGSMEETQFHNQASDKNFYPKKNIKTRNV